MSTLNSILTHPAFPALAAALLHSLWLFALVTAVGGLLVRRLSRPAARYRAYLLTLLSWPLLFAAVWGMEYRAATGAWGTAVFLANNLGAETTLALTNDLTALGVSATPRWPAYLAAAYLVGLLIALVVQLGEYRRSRWVRRGGRPPGGDWVGRFAALRAAVVPGRRVAWRVSERVGDVLLVGVFRPVILFPVGLLNGLTAAEVEAVLRHELTHLHRRDPWWNAVQQLLTAVFFYHPLVYWLSARLDREREFACDDAVAQTTDRQTYARALLRVANHSLTPKSPFTMAATDANTFTHRIQRLFAPADPLGRRTETRSYLLAPLAVLPVLALLAFAGLDAPTLPQPVKDSTGPATGEIVLTGTVTDGDTDQPLIGATVIIADTEVGTITNLSGEYELRLPAGAQQIEISYVGYGKANFMVARAQKNTRINAKLFKNGTSSLEFEETGVIRLEHTNGFDTKLQISSRKTTDVKESDNLLFIVDGKRFERGTMEDIDPNNIESIEVIKTAEKIADLGYGSDFAGAILIKLKTKE